MGILHSNRLDRSPCLNQIIIFLAYVKGLLIWIWNLKSTTLKPYKSLAISCCAFRENEHLML